VQKATHASGLGLDFHLKKQYPNFALDIEFQMGRELVVLLAPSGAGKSLTLNLLAGIVKPDCGYIRLFGEELYNSQKGISVPMRKRRIGYVFQDYALFPHKTVWENIAYGIRDKSKRHKIVAELLGMLDLTAKSQSYPSQLSGGQKQRIALARALAAEPRLLLMDEPLSALDEAIRERLQYDLMRLRENFDVPMIYVTHSHAEAFTLADRIIILDAGKVVESGAKNDIFYRPQKRQTAEFLGVRNIFPCVVKAIIPPDEMRVILLNAEICTPLYTRFKPKDKVYLGINPIDVRLVVSDNPKENLFDAMVVDILPMEKSHRIRVKLLYQEHYITMDLERLACEKWKVKIGQIIQFSLRKEGIFLCD